jgi:hypothetical protein
MNSAALMNRVIIALSDSRDDSQDSSQENSRFATMSIIPAH